MNNNQKSSSDKKQAGLTGYIALGVIFLCGVALGSAQSIFAAVKLAICGQ